MLSGFRITLNPKPWTRVLEAKKYSSFLTDTRTFLRLIMRGLNFHIPVFLFAYVRFVPLYLGSIPHFQLRIAKMLEYVKS